MNRKKSTAQLIEKRNFSFMTTLVFLVLMHSLLIACRFSSAEAGMPQQSVHDDLFGVSFPDGNNGWACGRWGTILHTADGGKTWGRQQTNTDFTLSSIWFFDNLRGWAVGDKGTIIHSKDGGLTWQAQKCPVPFFLMDVEFVSPEKGWVVTERSHILYTNDGGKTWSIQFKGDDIILKSISFCDEMNGWAAGEYGYIYHTKNGGNTWSQEAGCFGFSEKTGQVEAGNQLFDLWAINPHKAWAVGIDGIILRTVDGKTWEKAESPIGKKPLFAITVNKTGAIIIAGKQMFFSSIDGGRSWKEPNMKPPFIYGWLYGVANRGRSGFAAVGKQGTIYIGDADNVSIWHLADCRHP
jgi:photosystem II stability/assembly factor-like uncharacterized protein